MSKLSQLTVALVAALIGSAASAVEVIEPWVRATPPGAQLSAGFVRLKADSGADRLLSASSPRAGRVEIHESRMDGEIMRMRALPDGVNVPANGEVALAPGGIHLMLLDLPKPLHSGEQISLTLQFENAGAVSVQAEVRHPGAASADHDHHH